jgi:hypothetical protein
MKRFLIIQDNRLIADRYAQEIVEGEIEATEEFENVEVGMILLDGAWQRDPQEIAEQAKQQRILELKDIITNKKLLDMDCTVEQAELRELLGL